MNFKQAHLERAIRTPLSWQQLTILGGQLVRRRVGEAPKISFLYQMNYFVNVLWKHFLQMVTKEIQSIVMTMLKFNIYD